jgi:hypothetical protein
MFLSVDISTFMVSMAVVVEKVLICGWNMAIFTLLRPLANSLLQASLPFCMGAYRKSLQLFIFSQCFPFLISSQHYLPEPFVQSSPSGSFSLNFYSQYGCPG